ncbi:MAG: NusG domain II-containing protein [Deferribacteraceae bacterium]|jgi:hypothetical protein|nr:NusG domain II-containing protein [Deferribacteraceae bacterium]
MKSGKKKLIRFKPGDIPAVAAVLILSVYFILSPKIKERAPPEIKDLHLKKLVLISGRQTISLPWEDDTIDLKKLIGREMVLEVQGGKARVVSSNCPDKICVNTGWVSECGHIAACLPNSVAVMIECR